ncbi:Uncharacterised protein [uncultured archaeon]|nr:Uncharacterised protein [uncultured archaeon]
MQNITAKPAVRRALHFRNNFAGNPLFKRHLVPTPNRGSLLQEAERIIKAHEHAETNRLPRLKEVEHVRASIYKFVFKGNPVAFKNTLASKTHGSDPASLRNDFLIHQRAVRLGKISADKYILRSPKVYGMVGQYLVMEYIEGATIDNAAAKFGLDKFQRKNFLDSAYQLEGNFSKLLADGALSNIKRKPQWTDVMVAGHNNGKWVFYLPYDYG